MEYRDGRPVIAARVQARIDKQWHEADKVRRTHHVIVNDGWQLGTVHPPEVH